jgi:DNA modification methylase
MSNGIPGGSKVPSNKMGPDGKFIRGDLHTGVNPDEGSGTSIFDPVLCELAYRWFSPSGGIVLDPFAGGSVRGIVAGKLGRQYIGVELRAEQVEANRVQADEIFADTGGTSTEITPLWHIGDSSEIESICTGVEADLVFSCPPYADLEVYSDDPKDISTMPYDTFLEAYRKIIAGAVSLLKDNRFACFVVGDIRDKKGIYRNFVSDTIAAFQDAGAMLYNEAILVTSVGSLPIRVGKQFTSSRKLGKTHQNVLVFVKGDPKVATQACGEIEIDESAFE